MSVQAYDQKIEEFFGDKRIIWKIFEGQKFESPKFEYPILFGIELEYEVKTPKDIGGKEAQLVYRGQVSDRLEHTYKSFAFAKHDGSLKNGFEVVSVPMSRDAHSEQWKPFFESAKENGLLVHANCGMHVHISRELLTPLQIGKIIEMVHSPNHKEFVKTLAGRTRPVYTGPHNGKTYTEIGIKKMTDVNHHQERYAALNLAGAQTIEFRFFKSTLDLVRMLQNLEFCDALVRFCWPSGASIKEIKENGLKLFSQFILENRKAYPNFADFMDKNGYISLGKKKVLKKRQPVEKKVAKSTVKENKFAWTWDNMVAQGQHHHTAIIHGTVDGNI